MTEAETITNLQGKLQTALSDLQAAQSRERRLQEQLVARKPSLLGAIASAFAYMGTNHKTDGAIFTLMLTVGGFLYSQIPNAPPVDHAAVKRIVDEAVKAIPPATHTVIVPSAAVKSGEGPPKVEDKK